MSMKGKSIALLVLASVASRGFYPCGKEFYLDPIKDGKCNGRKSDRKRNRANRWR